MIVVVTGSRTWASWPWDEHDHLGRDSIEMYALTCLLDGLRVEALADMTDFRLIHGDCPTGADNVASWWASRRTEVVDHVFHADWDRNGRVAGPIRNRKMIDWVVGEDDGTFVIACFRGTSRGTTDCAAYAKGQGLDVIELRYR